MLTSLRDWSTTDEAAARHTRSWAEAVAAVRPMKDVDDVIGYLKTLK